jgi:hypothetical protein
MITRDGVELPINWIMKMMIIDMCTSVSMIKIDYIRFNFLITIIKWSSAKYATICYMLNLTRKKS